MARETGKQRSQRIQIDYYRKLGGLHRLKQACVIVALALAGTYSIYVLAAGGQSHVSTGALSRAHASFENDCGQCHQDFTPIDSRGAKLDLPWVGVHSKQSIEQIETSCQTCHPVGSHHRAKMDADWQQVDQHCSGCHADHRGRDYDLNLIATSKCTSCHAGLNEGCTGEATVRPEVSAFTLEQHGDFRSLAQGDPGKIKFDHRQHMLPGQVNEGEKGAFTIAMLDQSLRGRYRKPGQADSAPVELECSSCHELAGNPAGVATLATDAELGRYLKPVDFQQHCSACHSMHPGMATENSTPLPHAVPWAKIDLLLAATISGSRATGQARLPRDDRQATPQPGEGLGSAATIQPGDSGEGGAVDAARQIVQTQCLKCHDEASITDEAIAAALSGSSEAMIPPRWFTRGLYDHGVHREIDCRYCHEAAFPRAGQVAEPAGDHEAVMISGIESCTGCHRDAESPTPESLASDANLLGKQSTWASDHCVTCHRYHTPRPSSQSLTHQPGSPTDPPIATSTLARRTPPDARTAE